MIDPIKIKNYLIEKNKQHHDIAEKYSKICSEYGKLLSRHQQLLANRIMTYKDQKKNLGVDMAVMFALQDNEWSNQDEFQEINEKLNEYNYTKKGLERVLDAHESEKISIQSLLKYDMQGEKYYEGT